MILQCILPQRACFGGRRGLLSSMPPVLLTSHRTPQSAFVAVLEAARTLLAERQAREGRRARMAELLEAEGLGQYIVACNRYVQDGTGGEEAALAAARAMGEEAAARAARRARMDELLAAEGLQQYAFVYDDYVYTGHGSEQDVLDYARQLGQREAARQARRNSLTAALQAEGIAFNGQMESAVYGYLNNATGTLEQGGRVPGSCAWQVGWGSTGPEGPSTGPSAGCLVERFAAVCHLI